MKTKATGHPYVAAFELLWSAMDRRAKLLTAITFAVVVLSALATALVPIVFKFIVDRLTTGGDRGALISAPLSLIFSYAAVVWISKSLAGWRAMLHGLAEQRIKTRLSAMTFRHVMSLPLDFHCTRSTGGLTQVLANGMAGYRIVVQHLNLTVFPVLTELLTIAGVLLYFQYGRILGVIAVAVALYIFAIRISLASIAQPAKGAAAAQIRTNSILTDSIANYETIKYVGNEDDLYVRLKAAVLDAERQWSEIFTVRALHGTAMAIVLSGAVATSLGLAAPSVQDGTMTVGSFVLVNVYVLQVMRPLELLGFAVRDTAQGMVFVDALSDLLRRPIEPDSPPMRVAIAEQPRLSFEHVWYSYDNTRVVLSDISIEVPYGGTIAFVGPSGCGKSTLVRLLGRLVHPTDGLIRLGDVPLSGIPARALRELIAIVPQTISLFNDTVRYNLCLGDDRYDEDDVVRAAKAAEIHEFIMTLENGYETRIGEQGIKLSGGERQRLAIARAVVRRARVLVLDEATSSLDSGTESRILRNLKQFDQEATTFVVAHRLSTVVRADEIIVLDAGCVVGRGTHSELLRGNATYSAMWHVQHGQGGFGYDADY